MRFLPLSVICLKIKPNAYLSMQDFPTPSSPKFSAQIGLVSILLLHKQGDIKHTQASYTFISMTIYISHFFSFWNTYTQLNITHSISFCVQWEYIRAVLCIYVQSGMHIQKLNTYRRTLCDHFAAAGYTTSNNRVNSVYYTARKSLDE